MKYLRRWNHRHKLAQMRKSPKKLEETADADLRTAHRTMETEPTKHGTKPEEFTLGKKRPRADNRTIGKKNKAPKQP